VQFGDLPQFVDFNYVARVAKVNASVMWALATGPSMPKNAQIVAIVLTNTTTLNWDANTEANLAGYEVVWRETTSPTWDHVIPVGNVTTVTLDIVKDNVQFACARWIRRGIEARSPSRRPSLPDPACQAD
jgi:hypothetical protein